MMVGIEGILTNTQLANNLTEMIKKIKDAIKGSTRKFFFILKLNLVEDFDAGKSIAWAIGRSGP
jgi:hypothetical protein